MLEANCYEDNCMATLTYSDEFLPVDSQKRGVLEPKHLQNWLKYIRASVSPGKIRFFGCGEYGDTSWRPHYHVALFNYPNCQFGQSRYSRYRVNCCGNCDRIRDTWRFGNIFVNELNTETAQYIAGYVTKKMTVKDDIRLEGRPPEFCRMSRRPGIGVNFMDEVASTLMEFNLEETQIDVPSNLRHGSRLLPLGRTLQRHLRKRVGLDEKTPQAILDALQEEMRPLREAAFDGSRSFKKEIIAAADQAVTNMEARKKIFEVKRRKL